MPNQYQTDQIGQLTERVELLLVRYEALQQAHALALEQISTLTQERDSFKSRLDTVRVRVNALIERLPESVETALSVGAVP